jgi:hypothetical protein
MTNRKYTNRSYLDALEGKVLIFDGAMGTSLQTQNLTAEHFGGERYNGCNDYLVISYPEAVEKVHRSFLVGVMIETDTSSVTTKANMLQSVIEITRRKFGLRLADEYSCEAHKACTERIEVKEEKDFDQASSELGGSKTILGLWQARSARAANCPPPMTPSSPTSVLTNWPTYSGNRPSV